VYTNLLTGQERTDVDFASHVSCTVEMVKLDKEYDVAVVDEIQMIANDQRGFAW
jgi:ATP-dependent RNA helicase SUPV3L1/SUV3